MTIAREISYKDIESSEELLGYRESIFQLFEISFGRSLCRNVWNWAYINNPFGEPIVSVALSNGNVVGHYAVIPMRLKNSEGTLDCYLSMTTMVSPAFRRYKLFQKLAERVYRIIDERDKPAVVLGFPNNNSAPGFKKRLGWTISEQYAVVQLKDGQEKGARQILQKMIDNDNYKIDMSGLGVKAWRFNKPNQTWGLKNGIGLKKTEFGSDMMYFESLESFESEVYQKNVNIILPVTSEDFDVVFPYRFGFRKFNLEKKPEFVVEMCLSDVF